MKNILTRIGMFAVAMVTLTSCLDEDPLFDPDKTTGVIELVEQAPLEIVGSIFPMNTLAFDVVPEDQFEVIVQYSGAYNAPEDITVTVELSPSDIQAYNDDQGLSDGDEYFLIEDNMYELPGGGNSVTVTIPQGEKKASFMVTVNPDQFGFEKRYSLPLRISQASGGEVSGNFSHMLYSVIAKNQWDGRWTNTYTGSLGAGTNSVTLFTTGQFTTTSNLIGIYSNQTIIEI
ncbi:DUF1735 domain-containing protein, partial [Algoriphagus sp. D3-2-R+10]|uniref:DUF1735 domain-containing protein n=1 Tax=Algoriphagus aurantiacus TaxID=3103948 RepID=UPI002B3975F8